MEKLTKRLIGKEDIAFDVSGINAQDSYVLPDGRTQKVTKINAKNIPLTQDTRNKLNGATNLEEAIIAVKNKQDSFVAEDIMTANTTVTFSASDTIANINNKIKQQKLNLGGFTLTFVFPQGIAQKLNTPISFEKFFNGKLIIKGESESSLSQIFDLTSLSACFRIIDCVCNVEIQNFSFTCQYSTYAIELIRSLFVYITNCTFSGNKNNIAIRYFYTEGNYHSNCSFYSISKTYIETNGNQKFLPLTGGTLTGNLSFNQTYPNIGPTSNTDYLALDGGRGFNKGGAIRLIGSSCTYPDYEYLQGGVLIQSSDGTATKQQLRLTKDNVTINNDPVITASKGNFTDAITRKTSINTTTAPATTIYAPVARVYDKDNQYISVIETTQGTGNAIRTNIVCGRMINGSRVNNVFGVEVDENGDCNYYFNGSKMDDFVTEIWNSDTRWYKVYKSGWVEQGGIATDMGENSEKTFTYSVPMRNVLSANASLGARAHKNGDWDFSTTGIAVTTTTATISKGRGDGANWVFWEVKGYKA